MLSSIKHALLGKGDPFLVLADFASYQDAHMRAEKMYADRARWAKAAIINSASMGKFSSDRSINDYVANIWNLKDCEIPASED